MDLVKFLEETPPGVEMELEPIARAHRGVGFEYVEMFPTINLFCSHSNCQSVRPFDSEGELRLRKYTEELFATYLCRTCRSVPKTYALRAKSKNDPNANNAPSHSTFYIFKFGEEPSFGPPTTRKVEALLGDEKEIYLKGRQCESQGLGIAAFTYYRRVVENQKTRIIEEMIKVCETVGADPAIIADLVAAKKETRFSSAVAAISHGLPDALKLQGHNPMTLLHDALSEGIHAESDEACLEMAGAIRRVLTELVARMSQALGDNAELSLSVAQLLQRKREREERKKAESEAAKSSNEPASE